MTMVESTARRAVARSGVVREWAAQHGLPGAQAHRREAQRTPKRPGQFPRPSIWRGPERVAAAVDAEVRLVACASWSWL